MKYIVKRTLVIAVGVLVLAVVALVMWNRHQASVRQAREEMLAEERAAIRLSMENARQALLASEAIEEEARQRAAEARRLADAEAAETKLLTRAAFVAASLKDRIKDPDSFRLNSAILRPNGSVCFTFRGKNSFAAVVPGRAVLTAIGKWAVYVESTDPVFDMWWAVECDATKPGDEVAGKLKRILPGLAGEVQRSGG